MKRRVLLILTEFPPSIGGMQTHAILLSRHLHESGSEVTIYTYRSTGNQEECDEVDASFPFEIHRSLSRVGYFRNLDVLLKAIKDFKPDIIYASTVFYGILEKLTEVPTICRSVGNDIMRPWIAYPYKLGSYLASNKYLEKRLYNFFKKIDKPELIEILFREKRLNLTTKSAKSATKILANSEFTKNLLEKVGVPEKRIQMVVGGVDAKYFEVPEGFNKEQVRQELGLPADKTILLTACRLVDKKGVDFLISALAASGPEEKKYHLVIVGKGRRLKRLQKLAYSMGVESHITFVGVIPYEKMPPYYWVSDIFVLASTVFQDPVTGLKDAETMGRVLCEANAAGIPIVATRSGGIPSVITHKDNGLLFPENDVIMFHNHIESILKNDKLRVQLIKNGLKKARDKFDWAHILKAHEKAFLIPHSVSQAQAAAPKP
jgi:phosphatidyl-myo-inositol dimannoside synthase